MPVNLVCEQCGNQYSRKPAEAQSRFCSRKCYHDSTRTRVALICEWCGVSFECEPGRISKKRFCSKSCKHQANHSEENLKPVIKTCGWCGMEFRCEKSAPDKYLYCGPACGYVARMARSDAKYLGQRFGKLVVLSRIEGVKGPAYRCKCDCGKEIEYRIAHLVDGTTVSCSCHRRENGKKMQKINGFGQKKIIPEGSRFVRLVVIKENGIIYGNSVAYDCRCDCGKVIRVSGRSLKTGSCKSCGCYHKDISREQAKRLFTKHGHSAEKWYLQWMKRRRTKADRNWTREMELLLFRLQPMCVVCSSDDRLAVDHVLPVSKGGVLEPGNVVVLCKSCNSAKHDRPLEQLDTTVASKIIVAAETYLSEWEKVLSLQ